MVTLHSNKTVSETEAEYNTQSIDNIFHTTIETNISNLKKEVSTQVQAAIKETSYIIYH